MKLHDLLKYEKIYIQTHDNPDPDALASAYGLFVYFSKNNKNAQIIYGGINPIRKSNLKLMIEKLNIDVTHYTDTDTSLDGLLLTVDCQHGEGNVTRLKATDIAIIDHHTVGTNTVENDMTEIHSALGSCSTLVWKMLLDEGMDITDNKNLNTALYYGLMTDTSNFVELHHPLDRDMMDELKYDQIMIYHFCNSNISLDEMKIAGEALIDYRYNAEYKYTLVAADPCDPNILGLISDLALQVDVVNTCIVYNETGNGYKFSVRSCIKEIHANDLAEYIAEGIGSGGGHRDKSGGYIDKAKYTAKYPDSTIQEYMNARFLSYFEDIPLIIAKDYNIDTTDMKKYYKKPIVVGYVDPTDCLPVGEEVIIRSLEGDFEVTVDGTFYVMIGIVGEVYFIEKEKFYRTYNVLEGKYDINTEYNPTLRTKKDGKSIDITAYARCCRAIGTTAVLAKPIKTPVKIFPVWTDETYMLGHTGDYIACKEDDLHDLYIIEKNIFANSYV